jgi:ribosomal protein L37AE/L43A
MGKRCATCRGRTTWLPELRRDTWRCRRCGRTETALPDWVDGRRAQKLAEALLSRSRETADAAAAALASDTDHTLLGLLLGRTHHTVGRGLCSAGTRPWVKLLAGIAAAMLLALPAAAGPFALPACGVTLPLLAALGLGYRRFAREDRLALALRRVLADLGQPHDLGVLLRAREDPRLRDIAEERMYAVIGRMTPEEAAGLSAGVLSGLTRLLSSRSGTPEALLESVIRLLSSTSYRLVLRPLRALAAPGQHDWKAPDHIRRVAWQAVERIEARIGMADPEEPGFEPALDAEAPIPEGEAEPASRKRWRLRAPWRSRVPTHRCPDCRRRMVWLPAVAEDGWRCTGCDRTDVTEATTDPEDRASEVAYALISRTEETQQAAQALLTSPSASPVLRRVIRLLDTTRGPGLSRQGLMSWDPLLRLSVWIMLAVGLFASIGSLDPVFTLLMVIVIILWVSLQLGAGLATLLAERMRSVLAEVRSPRFVRALIDAAADPRLQDVAEERIVALLPELAADAARLDTTSLRFLLRYLSPQAAGGQPGSWGTESARTVLAAIRVFSGTTYTPALATLRPLAEPGRWQAHPPIHVQEAARAAVESLNGNVRAAEEARALLRAASPEDADSETLLRRPQAEEPAAGELLRPADQP